MAIRTNTTELLAQMGHIPTSIRFNVSGGELMTRWHVAGYDASSGKLIGLESGSVLPSRINEVVQKFLSKPVYKNCAGFDCEPYDCIVTLQRDYKQKHKNGLYRISYERRGVVTGKRVFVADVYPENVLTEISKLIHPA